MITRGYTTRVAIGYFFSLSLFVLKTRAWMYRPYGPAIGFHRRGTPLKRSDETLTTVDENNHIMTLHGSWNSSHFGATGCWCRRPLLLRQAFPSATDEASPLPSWQQIIDLACCASRDEDQDMADALTCRLIQHVPNQLDSFTIEFGPFDDSTDMNTILQGNNDEKASTLVVNDVDRWIPELSDWMDEQFNFLPRWRRDDAQISLAADGGGIGPHVDNYDVFLIQTSGIREWEVSVLPISVEQEYATLVEDSQVRILNMTQIPMETVILTLEPGDCLYIPPRFIHCGTAHSDDCVTLSVGCRAPSAADLLTKLAESVAQSSMSSATRRYVDEELFNPNPSLSGGLTKEVTLRMKDLIVDLVQSFVNDEEAWGDMVGKMITEPNRPIMDYPVPLYDIDADWKSQLGVWGSGTSALNALLMGNGSLRRAEGITFAWSYSEESKLGYLYAQGRSFQINGRRLSEGFVQALLDRISNGPPITKVWLEREINYGLANSDGSDFLCELINEGLMYGDDSQ